MPHATGLPVPRATCRPSTFGRLCRSLSPTLFMMFAAAPAWSAGINLSWNECGSAGTDLKTFACNTNAGPSADLYASFVPPAGINQLLGLSAEVRIASTNLPDWWKHGAGECRGTTSLFTDFELPPGACADFWSGRGVVGDKLYTLGAYGPNTARLVVQCAVPFDNAAAVSASNEYYAFRVRIMPSQSTGAGSCAGCSNPVNLRLERVQLFQPPAAGNDPILTTAVLRKTVNWQAVTGANPAISNFTPGGGAPGAVVTINGSGFTATSSVSFGGVSSTPTSVTDSQVRVPVPAGGRSAPLVLVTPFGSAQSAGTFLVSPRVVSFLPKQGPVGMSLTVKGQNFTSATAVRFNGLSSTFSVLSDSAVQATVPAGATTGPIRIEHAFGFGVSDSVFRVGTASGALNLSWDACGGAGSGLKAFACNSNAGDPFTFYGSFAPPPGVNQLQGLVADLRIFSGSALPDWWKFGLAQCRGNAALTSSMVFTGETSPCVDPWLSRAVTSTSYIIGYDGPNTARLTIQGAMGPTTPVDPGIEYQGFKVAIARTRTTLDGSCAGCATPVSITLERMQLLQPAAAGFNPEFGLPIFRNQIAWQAQPGPPPVITSFTPTAGPVSTPVTVRGHNFTGALSVRFAGTTATFTVPSDSVIQTSVPAGARTGSITVVTAHGSGSSTDPFVVPPIIRRFVPRQAPVDSSVAILGNNFTGTTALRFNGTPATFTIVNDSLAKATVPIGATTGPISMVNPAGTTVSDSIFTVGAPLTGFIDLAWNECGSFGTASQAFACNDNNASFPLLASFVPPPDVVELVGMTSDMRIASFGTLPDWWKHGAGQCRGAGALPVSVNFLGGPFSCVDPWTGTATATSTYDIGFYGPTSARLRVTASIPGANRPALSSNSEYYAFRVDVLTSKAAGSGSCAGCAIPMALTLENLQLLQTASLGYNPVLTAPRVRNVAYWQAQPGPVPAISGFTPPGGAPGASVTIRGLHFANATAVRFGPANASFTVPSDTAIVATVPAAAETAPIQVASPQGVGESDSVFVVAPVITDLIPQTAPVGATIAIRGRHFTRTTSVRFTSSVSATFTIVGDSLIRATVPPGAVNGPITVTNAGGSAASEPFAVGPTPQGAVDLAWDDCGVAGFKTKTFACNTATGSAFDLFGSFAPPPDIVELTGIDATVRIASTGPLPNWWRFGAGQCRASSPLGISLNFSSGPTSCSDFWLGRGGGTLVYDVAYDGPNTARLRVLGAMNGGATAALTSGIPYYAFRVSVPRDLTCSGCTTPVSLTLQQIQLLQTQNLGYDPVMSAPLHDNAAWWQAQPGPLPVINSFSPPAGAPGQHVTVLGSHFTGASAVRFGGISGTFSVIGDGEIDATVPAGARTGPIGVVTVQGSGASATSFIVAPTITSFAPRQAPEGYAITIHGFNFANASDVRFNGLGATFTLNSDSVLIADVPVGATSGPITVQNPGGTGTSPFGFTVGELPPGFINLSWNDCGAAGIETLTSACSNIGPGYELIASFEPPAGITELLGISGDLRINTGGDLPDWWRYGVGQCRGTTNLTTSFNFTTGPTACADTWTGRASGNYTYEIGFGGTNMARLVVSGYLPYDDRRPVEPGTEYYAFRVRILPAGSSGTGSCAGCLTATRITLREIQLFQTAKFKYDPVITTARDRKVAYWQAVPGPAAAINRFTPTAGGPGQGVTIYGARFSGTSSVLFNTASAPFTVVDDTTITTTVPNGARTGPLRVTGPNGTISTTDIFIVAPDITSFTPLQAPLGAIITITGVNFTQTQSVDFNGAAASFVEVSDTQLRATVPSNATDGPIRVTNAGGIDLSDRSFTIGPQVSGTGINLSWSDCGAYGTQTVTFACNTNTGSLFSMVGSFLPPPNVNEFLGQSTTIDITSPTATLPDWWKHGTGQCRGTTGLTSNFDFTSGPFNCADFYVGQAAGGHAYDVGYGTPNRARLRIQSAVPIDNRGPLDVGTEYYAFKANISRSKTTGTGSCTGCDVPMCIVLSQIQLFQPPELAYDPILFVPAYRNYVTWQSDPAGCPFTTAALASLVSSDASGGIVTIVWRTESVDPVTVYRREGEAGAWQSVASIVPDGSHRVRFEDRNVVGGRAYDYRIGVTVPAGEVYAGETQVQVPVTAATASLELSAVNVNGYGLALLFTLPRASNAAFEVYDLSGRRQLSRPLEGLKAGPQRIEISGGSSLRSGVYFARLVQDTHTAQRRFVVVR